MSEAAIEVSGLRKRFGPTAALDGMSFTAEPCQVTGFVRHARTLAVTDPGGPAGC
jgi:ABC-type uncharacterized transport system ATPase subunit